jgi:hypothetical protein
MAGVMIRVLLIPGSPSIFMGISANTDAKGHAITMWGRAAMNGAAGDESTGDVTPPYWVKVKRTGNTFAGYSSPNGKDWTERYTTSAPGMPQTIYIGYAVMSEVSASCSPPYSTMGHDGHPANRPGPGCAGQCALSRGHARHDVCSATPSWVGRLQGQLRLCTVIPRAPADAGSPLLADRRIAPTARRSTRASSGLHLQA